MFRSLDLREYGGIKKCEKPLELKKFTVLIGPNNSAKTTVLTALFQFLLPKPSSENPLLFTNKELFIGNYLNRTYRSLIYRYSGKAVIEVEIDETGYNVINDDIEKLRIEIREPGTPILFYKKSGSPTWTPWDGSEVSLLFKTRNLSKIASSTVLIPNSDLFMRELEEKIIKEWVSVEKTGVHANLVRDLVRKGIIGDRFTEVNIRFNNLVVRKELPKDDVAYINLSDLGDGLRKFLLTSLWLEALKPMTVLWDDLEASAHPSLISYIIKWLSSKNWQIVISTHSIDVLYELVQNKPEDAIVLSLRKTWDDILRYRTYTLDELEKMFDSGQDVRKILV